MRTDPTFSAVRRLALAAPCALLACAQVPPVAPAAAQAPQPGAVTLLPWRTVQGGFVAASDPLNGLPPRTGIGPFVNLVAPTALALWDQDLVVGDSGTRRLWRVDLVTGSLVPLAGPAVTPATTLAMAPDRTLWVFDGAGGRLHRLGRDARALQSFGLGAVAGAAAGLALADLGSTVLLADPGLGQWIEWRPLGGMALPVRPHQANGGSVAVDAMAAAGGAVWVLDRRAGLVHRADRDGQVLATLGAGALRQPVALAADARGRVWVLDAQEPRLVLLREGQPPQVFGAAVARLHEPVAIAADERGLAVADRVPGQVVLYRIQESRP